MFSSILELADRVMAGVGGMSPLQRAFVKAISGEALAKDEIKLWRAATGRTGLSFWRKSYTPRSWGEIWLLCGRRSFKTTLGAILTIWEATRRNVPAGQDWKIPILCPGLRQGKKGSLDVVRSIVKAIPEVAELVVADSVEAMTFATGVEVMALPPKVSLVQGWTCPLIWCDEAANFSQEDTSESNLADILEAIRPSVATTNGGIYVCSLPGPDIGTIFEKWEQRFNEDALVFKASSVEMNPSLERSEEFQKARKRGGPSFQLYWSGEFVKARSGLLPPTLVDAAIMSGRIEIPPAECIGAAAVGCDFATGGDTKSANPKAPDDCAAAIAIKVQIEGNENERIIVPWIRKWSVRAGELHPVYTYFKEIADACASYGVRYGVGDKESLAAATQYFGEKCHIEYSHLTTNGIASEPVFDYLRDQLREGRLFLVDDPVARSQLKALEERRDGGRSYEVAARKGKDDVATAIAGAVYRAGALKAIPANPFLGEAVFASYTGRYSEDRFFTPRERIPSFARPRF